jgi:hypothetical protein
MTDISGMQNTGCKIQVNNNKVISMKTLIIKALLTSLYQREEASPSLAKRGEGRFFNNDINQEGG